MSAARRAGVAECKKLVDEMFRTVRDLALGLRPSMLDDFGLQAALEWHVRDFRRATRSTSSWRSTAISSPAGQAPHLRLPRRAGGDDQLRAPRAGAGTSDRRHDRDGQLRLSVSDDGVGLDPRARRKGLGLRGIDERVKELDGTMTMQPEAGPRHHAGGPAAAAEADMEVPLARAAG